MRSPWVFSIAPCFNPICFAQSPPLLTYIGGRKGEALHLSIESSNFWEASGFQLLDMGQSNSTKKKVIFVGGKGRAKNGDELFWEEKFPAANGKARAHAKGALHFSVWGRGFRRGYFSVFPCSF